MGTSRTVTSEFEAVSSGTKKDRQALLRLEMLLAENAAFEKRPERADSSVLVDHPVSTEAAVAGLGMLTGAIPTSAIFLKLIFDGPGRTDPGAAVALTLIILFSVAATSTAGYYSGKLTGKILRELEEKSWPLMLLALPFVGMTWGLLSGAVGGFILFGIGAIFGGAIGALVGAAVLTFFGVIHRSVKVGDAVERNKLLPLSIGITSAVAAFILGL